MLDSRLLRHPLERPLFAIYVSVNIAIMVGAVALATHGADWGPIQSLVGKYRTQIRAVGVIAVLGPIAVTFFRNIRCALIRGNSLMLSSRQLPQLYELFARQCVRLAMDPPELYFSDAIRESASAYTGWRKKYIVLGTKFLQPDLGPMLPVLAFLLGRELGRLTLGHASWLNDLLLTYTHNVPYLRNPLSRVFVYSEDRWGAFLAVDGLNGLIALASGRLMLPQVNVADYLPRVRSCCGIWEFLGEMIEGTPSVARRIDALREAGLLRFPDPTSASVGASKNEDSGHVGRR